MAGVRQTKLRRLTRVALPAIPAACVKLSAEPALIRLAASYARSLITTANASDAVQSRVALPYLAGAVAPVLGTACLPVATRNAGRSIWRKIEAIELAERATRDEQEEQCSGAHSEDLYIIIDGTGENVALTIGALPR